jgi:hypothetical protein
LHPKGVHASSIIVFLPQIHFSNLSLLRYRKQICFYNYYYRTFFLSLKVSALERGSPSNNKEIILNGTYLTLSFLPPYNILDYLDIMKNSIVSPIGGLVALISSIIVGGFNMRKLYLNRHRREEERHKTQKNDWGIG